MTLHPLSHCEWREYERNAMLAALVKELQGGRCEVCGSRFKTRNDEWYSEVHHILPLNMGGLDRSENMVVVCPTCHMKFHHAPDSDVKSMGGNLGEQRRGHLEQYIRRR